MTACVTARLRLAASTALLASACATLGPGPDRIEVPVEGELERAIAEATDPTVAFDLALLVANDRARAGAILSRAPDSAPLLLRRALLAHLELDDAALLEAALGLWTRHPAAPEAEAALALVLQRSGLYAADCPAIVAAIDAEASRAAFARAPGKRALAASLGAACTKDAADAEARLEAGGFVTRGRAFGPFAPPTAHHLKRPHRVEAQAFGPGGEGPVEVRPFHARRGIVPIAGGRPAGVFAIETWIRADAPVDLTFQLWASRSGHVAVDGRRVFAAYADEAEIPGYSAFLVQVAPGWHRVTYTSIAGGGEAVSLSILGPDGPLVGADGPPEAGVAETQPGAATRLTGFPVGFQAWVDRERADRRRAFMAHVLGGWLALSPGSLDLPRARRLISPIESPASGSAVYLDLLAELRFRERLPALAQATLRRALGRDPRAPNSLVRLARAARDDFELARSMAKTALAESRGLAPRELTFELLLDRGFDAEAEAALTEALAVRRHPELLRRGAGLYRRLHRIADARRLEEEARALEAQPLDSASLAIADGDLDRATAELLTLASVTDPPGPLLDRAAELELGRDAHGRAAELAEAALAADPRDASALRTLAMAALAAGERERGLAALKKYLEVRPSDLAAEILRADLEGLAPALPPGSEGLAAELATDVHAMLAAAPRGSSFPRVVVLDRLVDWVKADGSAISSHHSVELLLTKEATDRAGEFSPPPDAWLLAARTIKRDGRIVPVDRHAGKNDLSFSDLLPGDAIEKRWIAAEGPRTAAGGYLRKFYFQDFAPMLQSELFVMVPKGTPVWWRAYHAAPVAEVHVQGEFEVYAFRRLDVPALTPEPSPAPAEEVLPHVVVAVGLDPETAELMNRSQVDGLTPRSLSVTETGRALGHAARSNADKLERIFRYVASRIRHGGFDTPAAVLAGRRGDRSGLLFLLAEAAGVPIELVLARPGTAAQVPLDQPDPQRFGVLLLRARVGKDDVRWMRVDSTVPWMGKAPPEFRGGSYVVVRRGGQRRAPVEPEVRFPDAEIDEWTIRSSAALDVSPDGSTHATIALELPGQLGARLRTALAPLGQRDRARALLGWVATFLPGSEIRRLETGNEDDPLLPYRVEVEVLSRGLFEPSDGGLLAHRFFNAPIGSSALGIGQLEHYLRTPVRTTPLLLETSGEELKVTVRLPAGSERPELVPTSFERDTPFGRFGQRVGYDAATRTLSLERSQHLLGGRVPPGAFPALRELIQEVALETRNRLLVPLPR